MLSPVPPTSPACVFPRHQICRGASAQTTHVLTLPAPG